mmetsp:Transcript_98836/g.275086  ORF Transcript_98836/g.275086 Transcript_98836/m.275086 type:complete len:230 (+) Transcript_98836:435-1124(+)
MEGTVTVDSFKLSTATPIVCLAPLRPTSVAAAAASRSAVAVIHSVHVSTEAPLALRMQQLPSVARLAAAAVPRARRHVIGSVSTGTPGAGTLRAPAAAAPPLVAHIRGLLLTFFCAAISMSLHFVAVVLSDKALEPRKEGRGGGRLLGLQQRRRPGRCLGGANAGVQTCRSAGLPGIANSRPGSRGARQRRWRQVRRRWFGLDAVLLTDSVVHLRLATGILLQQRWHVG